MNFDADFIEKSLNDAIRKKQSLLCFVERTDKPSCSIDGCGRKLVGKGFCNVHYIRSRKGEDLLAPVKVRKRKGTCSFCDSEINGKGGWGLCQSHYRQERVSLIKDTLILLFGNSCYDCKKEYPRFVYDFHHITGEKEDNPSLLINNSSISIISKEMSKCILLCANCHRSRHYEF